MESKRDSKQIGGRQKKLFWALLSTAVLIVGTLIFMVGDDEEPADTAAPKKEFDVVSQEIDPQTIRLRSLEQASDEVSGKLQHMESALEQLLQEKGAAQEENRMLKFATEMLSNKLQQVDVKLQEQAVKQESAPKPAAKQLKSWERTDKKDDRNVLFEIPAGTVLKAVLVSGADCSVAVSKPTGPNMVLLRPLDNGHLPRNVRVPLKGSVILGNAIGDISSERVYVRSERMTLVEKNGNFVETEISAYVSGEDGREGMRGVVVDRSGQILTRAAFASFLQGIGNGFESAFQIKALATDSDWFDKSSHLVGSSALHGSGAAFSKLSDYYIKRAEQLQPAIQIAAGRVVDVVFTKSVKVGEKDLKKQFQMQRAMKRGSHE